MKIFNNKYSYLIFIFTLAIFFQNCGGPFESYQAPLSSALEEPLAEPTPIDNGPEIKPSLPSDIDEVLPPVVVEPELPKIEDKPSGYVFHLIGQSNAVGWVKAPSNRVNKIEMLLPSGEVMSTISPPNQVPGQFGVETVLAEIWKEAYQPILLKTALGGIPISYFNTKLLPVHIQKIKALVVPEGYQHVVLWVQGESDALESKTVQSNYVNAEKDLFSALTKEVPDIKIFSVRINPKWVISSRPELAKGIAAINLAKETNAQDINNVFVIGGDYHLNPLDIVHYDSQGLEDMAIDFLENLYN